jgi:hypothetical protein
MTTAVTIERTKETMRARVATIKLSSRARG